MSAAMGRTDALAAAGVAAAIVIVARALATRWRARRPRQRARAAAVVGESRPGRAMGLAGPLALVGRASRRSPSGRGPAHQADERLVGGVIVAGSLIAAALHPVVGALVVLVIFAPPVLHRRRARRRRAEAVVDELPEVVDLLHLAVSAGLNLRLALDVVVAHSEGCCTDALASVVGRVQHGQRLVDALDDLLVLGAPARPLHEALVASERHGTPILDPLGRVADEVRVRRRQRHDERARRLPVALLFPLVCCTLPALALVTVVPVVARPWLGPAP
jgi:tight adherence protein C